jgi:chlorobactene glucosyltransferase
MVGLTSFALLLFVLYILGGLFLYGTKIAWKHRTVFSALLIIILINASFFVLFFDSLAALALLLVNFYAIFNLLIVIKNNHNAERLYSVTSKSFGRIVFLQLIIMGFMLIGYWYEFVFEDVELQQLAFLCLALFGLFVAIYTTVKLFQTIAFKKSKISFDSLPTVTVAIAARNEDDQLHSCLESVVNDSYEKLEIIVYDDESQDNTAELIRQYARDGVRFIKGSQVPEDWLAKNLAYQKLLDQASGDIIFFIGTDIRLHKNSINRAVEFMQNEQLDMLCLMPIRTRMGILAAFVQPMRYWWELAVPRLFPKRPPSLSSAWLVNRRALLKKGGFMSFKRSITPEEHLAKIFAESKKYGFARSNKQLFVSTHKKFDEQWETAVRTRYPQLHRRPELMALRMVYLGLLLMPFIFLPIALFSDALSDVRIYVYIAAGALVYSHIAVSWFTNHYSVILAPINFPIIIILDIFATNLSAYRYEFSEVIWKGRVVNPRLKVYKKLPKLD